MIYCSRTHTKIKQIVREIKKTVYRPKMMVLASRDQMCINQDVRNLPHYAQRASCHFLGLTCPFHRNVNGDILFEMYHTQPPKERDLMDIEDLYALGKRRNVWIQLYVWDRFVPITWLAMKYRWSNLNCFSCPIITSWITISDPDWISIFRNLL